jgi:hypothetical protein
MEGALSSPKSLGEQTLMFRVTASRVTSRSNYEARPLTYCVKLRRGRLHCQQISSLFNFAIARFEVWPGQALSPHD